MDLTPDEQRTAVYLTNVSSEASQSTLSDFFSFCGNIKKLNLERDPVTFRQTAVVVFEDAAAAETALLLSNAVIIDKPVTITALQAVLDAQAPQESAVPPPAADTVPIFNNGEQPSGTSRFFSNAFAKVSQARQSTFAQLKAFDERHNVTTNLKKTTETLKLNLKETGAKIDSELHVAEKFAAFGTAVGAGARKVDETLHIKAGLSVAKEGIVKASISAKETAVKAGSSVKDTAAKVKDQVSQSQIASKGAEGFKSLGQKVNDSFSETARSINLHLGRNSSLGDGMGSSGGASPFLDDAGEQQLGSPSRPVAS